MAGTSEITALNLAKLVPLNAEHYVLRHDSIDFFLTKGLYIELEDIICLFSELTSAILSSFAQTIVSVNTNADDCLHV